MGWNDIKNLSWKKIYEIIKQHADEVVENKQKENDVLGANVSGKGISDNVWLWLYSDEGLNANEKYTISEYMDDLLNTPFSRAESHAWSDFNKWKSQNKVGDNAFSKYWGHVGVDVFNSTTGLATGEGIQKSYKCKKCGYILVTDEKDIDKLPDCPRCGGHEWNKYDALFGMFGVDFKKSFLKDVADPFVNLAEGSYDFAKNIYEDVTSFDYIKKARDDVYDIVKYFLRAFSVDPIVFFCCALVSVWKFEEREASEHGWKFGPKIEDVRKYLSKFISILELLTCFKSGGKKAVFSISFDIRKLLNWVFKVMWLGVAIVMAKTLIGNIIKTGFMKLIANLRKNAESPTIEGASTTVILECTPFIEFLKYLEMKLLSWNNGIFGLLYKYYRQLFKLMSDFRLGEIKAFQNLIEFTYICKFYDFLHSLLEVGYGVAICIGGQDKEYIKSRLPSYYNRPYSINYAPSSNFNKYVSDDFIEDSDMDIMNWYIDTADLKQEDKENLLHYVVVPSISEGSDEVSDEVLDSLAKSFNLSIKDIKKFK